MSSLFKKIRLFFKNIIAVSRSVFYKRDPSIVVMDSWFGKRFADNPRFLYQYLSDNKQMLGLKHVVWLSRNENIVTMLNTMGYESYLLGTDESILYHKKAKYLICNNAPVADEDLGSEMIGEYSYGAKCINLWHGVGVVKGVGYERNEYLLKRSRHQFLYSIKEFLHSKCRFYRKYIELEGGWGDCYFVAPTAQERLKMQKELLLPKKNFIITGYSRNCECVRLLDTEKKTIEKIRHFSHSIIYMPTFKTGSNNFDFRTVGLQLQDFLKENDILWVQKGHAADKYSADYNLDGNVLSLTSDFDTNVILPYVDAVVTDYSSAMMDALYHDKPVLLFTPDYDEFVNGERGLLPDAEEIMSGCGFIYRNYQEFIGGLNILINQPETLKPTNYYRTKAKYWGNPKRIEDIWDDIQEATK